MEVNKRPKGKAPPAALPLRLKFQPDLAIDNSANMMIIMALGTRFYQTKETKTMSASKMQFNIGDKVIYRGGFGSSRPVATTIVDIGDKDGVPVFDTASGSWGYADQFKLGGDGGRENNCDDTA